MRLVRAVGAFVRTLVHEAAHWRVEYYPWLGPTAGAIIAQFRRAGAITPRTAKRYYPRSRREAATLALLLEESIVCQVEPGRYFLNLDLSGPSEPLQFWMRAGTGAV
jgi:hypothetical protein